MKDWSLILKQDKKNYYYVRHETIWLIIQKTKKNIFQHWFGEQGGIGYHISLKNTL